MGFFFFFLQKKRSDEKNLLLFPFCEEGNMFLLGEKDNIQLALSFSKFLHLCLIGAREAETIFALRL